MPDPLFTTLAPDAGEPLYRTAKRALLAAIEDGRQPPGARLPNEAALAAAFGVAVGTLRQAVGELVAEHILLRHQGRGTFVATHSAERFLFQFFNVERRDGVRDAPVVDLISLERGRLDEEEAEALHLRPGDAAWLVENRLRLQGRAVVHDRLALPMALFKGLTERRLRERPGTLYRLYQDAFGITVLRALERARAVAADIAIARALGVAPGTPMLQLRRTALSFGDRRVEYRVSTVNTALHDVVQMLSRPAEGRLSI